MAPAWKRARCIFCDTLTYLRVKVYGSVCGACLSRLRPSEAEAAEMDHHQAYLREEATWIT